MSLRKYLFSFLKTALFFVAGLLLYLFSMLVYLKFKGDASILTEALRNYGLFLLYSIPFILIVASCFYFGFLGNDKVFFVRMIPFVALFNTVVMLAYFLVQFSFEPLPKPTQLFFYPETRPGYVNTIGSYQLFAEPGSKENSGKGILFYKNAYFVNSWNIKKNEISVSSSQYVGRGEITRQSSGFTIPGKEPVIQLQQMGIADWLFRQYITYLNKLREFFYMTFAEGGLPASILAIFFMSMGFFGMVCGIAGFMNDKQMLILTVSALFLTAGILFFIMPQFLSLIALIRFGIKMGFFRVTIPSLFVGLLAGMIGYALIEFRDLLLKRSGNRS